MPLFATIFQCGNAVAEGRNLTSVLPDQKSRGDKKNARINCEAKDQAQKINDDNDDDDDDMISGVTGFVADPARKSTTKAMDTAEAVGETVKQAMDSANFDVKEETTSTQNMKETVVVADTNVVNTAEYRSNQDAAKQADIKEGY